MADESPPPNLKETDPLRNKVLVFEKQSSRPNTPSIPPPIRPKPGKTSWTKDPASLPPPLSSKGEGGDVLAESLMSVGDAQGSVGLGINERVAGLEGKTGFGPEILNPEDQEGRRRAEVARRQRVGWVRIWGFEDIGQELALRQPRVPEEETKPGIYLVLSDY